MTDRFTMTELTAMLSDVQKYIQDSKIIHVNLSIRPATSTNDEYDVDYIVQVKSPRPEHSSITPADSSFAPFTATNPILIYQTANALSHLTENASITPALIAELPAIITHAK